MERPRMIRPGIFSIEAAADRLRGVFDAHNEALIAHELPVDAVFFGDSITEMWDLGVFFEGTGGRIINRGIGGDRTVFARRRFEADVLQLRPRLLVIKIGVNNTWDLDIWWDAGQRREPREIEDEIVNDLAGMVRAARERGIAVALCGILPTDVPFNGNTATRNALILRANARIREIASEHGAVYVNYHARLAGDDGQTLRAGLADDGLHPHVQGYQIMAATLLEALDEAGIGVIRARS
ncbi:MAG TPA: GDSL-type esterase/lipase family protein [Chloroflexota bacterium]|nr:GDSL-type esterase/lipase family protein [Chloroflexota bacterium]